MSALIGLGNVPVITHSDILARTIFGEARGQSYEGQVAVGWVVRNRVLHPTWWGRTFTEVCLKPFQFSCWNEGKEFAANRARMLTATMDDPAFLRACGIAALMITGDLVPDPTGGATHYHAPMPDKPGWTYAMKQTAVIEAHTFYV